MYQTRMNRIRQFFTILLIFSAMSGAQLIQASSLHDHDSEIASCVLCHFDSNDHFLPETKSAFLNLAAANEITFYSSDNYHHKLFPLFQGRAPPLFSY